ncbi:hypothetical protein G7046_g2806 [Stylonectria norvegica]|nr:hypothetical protein G7046_g2806 [Stylonectria norvegica]
MADQNKGTIPRIAIKFGTPSSSSTLKKPSRPNPPSTLGKRPRHNAWGGGSDSENDEDKDSGRHEKITGFGAGGAETERKRRDLGAEKKELAIARQPNRDWRADARRRGNGKNLLPPEARAQQNGPVVETAPADQDTGVKWGLSVKEKTDENDPENKEQDVPGDSQSKEKAPSPEPTKRTVDEEALDALIGNVPDTDAAIIHPSEEDAFQRDIQQSGEASTLADYEAMPVDDFGAALLRGMGWDGKPQGARKKEVKRRPARLGLGAKELKEDEDLGGWGQNGKKKRRPRLDEYRREEAKRKEGRRDKAASREEASYTHDRERERDRGGHRESERDRDRNNDKHRDQDYDNHRDRARDYDKDRRR